LLPRGRARGVGGWASRPPPHEYGGGVEGVVVCISVIAHPPALLRVYNIYDYRAQVYIATLM